MKYVLTENGNIKIGPGGHPMVLDGDKEIEINALDAQTKITSLNAEAAKYRKERNSAREVAAHLEGIDDPAEFIKTAQANADTVASMDDKNKADVDAATANLNKTWQKKEETWNEEKKGLEGQLFESNVKGKFATSKTVGNTVLTPGIAFNTFKDSFKNDGTAVDADGNPILSKENPAKPAGFDEALGVLIDSHPDKDSIWKGTGAAGPGLGNQQQGDGGAGGYESGTDLIRKGLEKRG